MQLRLMGVATTLAFGAVAGGSTLQAPPRDPAQPDWLPSYTAAQTAARQSGKPIFLVFR